MWLQGRGVGKNIPHWITAGDVPWTRTGSDGTVLLNDLADVPTDIGFVAEGHGMAWRSVTPPLDGPLRVELEPRFAIEGVVVAPDGRPLSGHYVTCWPGGPDDYESHDPPNARTDEEGRFRIRGLPEGAYRVAVRRRPKTAYVGRAEGVDAGTNDLRIVVR